MPFAQVSIVGLRHKLGHKLSHKYQRPILVRRFLADSFSLRPSVSDPSTQTRALIMFRGCESDLELSRLITE